MKQEFLFSPILFSVVLEVANATRQEKEINGIKMEKEEGKKKVSIPSGHVYVENPKESAKMLLELIREFSKVTGIKVNKRDTPKYPNLYGSKWWCVQGAEGREECK